MRTKHLAIIIVALALGSATTVTVIGQQEPLPVVQPKQAGTPLFEAPAPANEVTVFLASYPISEYRAPTIAEAARNNDYVTFDALYREAVQRGENVSAFATLHELWTWAISDPIGAFYGRDVYQRLAGAYPGFNAYIAEFAITDSNGNVYWPTSETRAFLLQRATAGEAPKTRLAQVVPARPAAPVALDAVEDETAPLPAIVTRRSSNRLTESSTRPVVRSSSIAAVPAPVRAAAAAPARAKMAPPISSAPMAPAVVISPAPETAAVTPAATPLVDSSARRLEDSPAPAAPQKSNPLAGRGILLLVLGLIGIGLLAVIFRTPKEEDEFVVVEPKPHAPVSPIRKQAAGPEGETRASGLHG